MKLKNFLGVTALTAIVAVAPVLGFAAPKAEAQVNTYDRNRNYDGRDRDYDRDNRDHDRDYYRHTRNHYDTRYLHTYRPVISVMSSRDYFRQHNLYNRYRNIYRNFQDMIFARNIVIINRDNDRDRIVIRNQNTGPFSVNQIVLRVNDDYFRRVSNRIDIDRNVSVRVNTGNNTVSFNTVVGDISTGDVDINID